jgi:molecular chaperone DnaK
VLGRFQLTNIRPAPRGEPQIEVTFDVDANGILHVTAKDKDTGAEQGITISESSNLDKAEVERMIAEADRNRSEDQRLREEVEARNLLDSAAYQVERALTDDTPSHEKARAEMLIEEAREAVKSEAPLDRVRSLTSELQQVFAALSSPRASGPSGPDGSGWPGGASQSSPRDEVDDDVIDADFERA